jgi:bZIP transcription factor
VCKTAFHFGDRFGIKYNLIFVGNHRMTNNTSFIQFQPITVLQGHHKQQQPRRTPSPADTAATISESFSTTASNNAMNMMMYTTTAADEYSPIPGGLDASSQSSPGSASDHMGVIPNTVASHGTDVHVQPLFPGSSILAAFDAGNPNLAYGQHPLPPQKQINPSLPLSSTSSGGVTVKSPVLARRKNGSGGGSTTASGRAATAKASSATTINSNSSSAGAQPGNTNRRQSRLQRNRESARLSRKRRKQYLELLEERVDKLSETLDGSRRQHVASAVATLNQKRIEYILQHNNNATGVATPGGNDATVMRMLENNLSRTNEDLMIATTFQYQQLKSFSIPPSMQFTLWLTLQTDTYFRGGRTASERLSAARIGERVRAIAANTICFCFYLFYEN